ncbi:MAG: hypothetical protein ACRD1Q_03125 [Vicinamibacterales bacterium]
MTAERLFSALLRLYPREFREEFGDALLEAFRELHQRTGHRPVRFWLALLSDLAHSIGREWFDNWRSAKGQFALRWVLACASGAVVTGAVGSALSWTFAYLYHPYLEGLTFPAWGYGALLGLGLGTAQVVALRARLRLSLSWVLASAACAALGLEVAVLLARTGGPVWYGLVLGCFVGAGQWIVLRRKTREAAWWVAASIVAVPVGILSCGLALNGTLQGLNQLSNDVLAAHASPDTGHAIGLLSRGLYAPANLVDLTVEFAVMATAGLVIAALTASALSSLMSRAR